MKLTELSQRQFYHRLSCRSSSSGNEVIKRFRILHIAIFTLYFRVSGKIVVCGKAFRNTGLANRNRLSGIVYIHRVVCRETIFFISVNGEIILQRNLWGTLFKSDESLGVRQMTQWLRAVAAFPEVLGLVPRTTVWLTASSNSVALFWPPAGTAYTWCPYMQAKHPYTENKTETKNSLCYSSWWREQLHLNVSF